MTPWFKFDNSSAVSKKLIQPNQCTFKIIVTPIDGKAKTTSFTSNNVPAITDWGFYPDDTSTDTMIVEKRVRLKVLDVKSQSKRFRRYADMDVPDGVNYEFELEYREIITRKKVTAVDDA